MPNALGFPNCSSFSPSPYHLRSTTTAPARTPYRQRRLHSIFKTRKGTLSLCFLILLSLFVFLSLPSLFALLSVWLQRSVLLLPCCLCIWTTPSLVLRPLRLSAILPSSGFFHGTSMSISFFFFFFLALFYPLVSLPSPDNKSMTGER